MTPPQPTSYSSITHSEIHLSTHISHIIYENISLYIIISIIYIIYIHIYLYIIVLNQC